LAKPAGAPKAALLVLQEIFGVNRHMKAVTDGFAAAGLLSLAPALFDRVKPGVELGYQADDVAAGRDLRAGTTLEGTLADMEAGIEALRRQAPGVKVGVIGYCWGGSLAFMSSTRLKVDAAVGYYGGQIVPFVKERPKAPVMLHFGEFDKGIPLTDVATIQAEHPDMPIHIYPAGHGFNCTERADYNAEASALALSRTMTFLGRNLGFSV
ncbi:MAG: dienelactone hydrolase family protein, partial [Brevundimonas sp.]